MKHLKQILMLCLLWTIGIAAHADEIPNDEIWYTSSDGNVVTPSSSNVFDSNIVSNTYSDGKGIIKCEANITGFGFAAFRGCTNLTSITIPNSVTTLEAEVFASCTGLTSVTIPNSVTTTGYGIFQYCTDLISVVFGNSVTCIEMGTFFWCRNLTSVTVGNSVTRIGQNAFEGCSKLTTINIPNSVTTIERGAFSGCSNLASIDLPNSVKYIEQNAFGGCSSLTTITIPSSVTSIEPGTFSGCTNLTSITIPGSVTSIGESAFHGCSSLPAENNIRYVGNYLVEVADRTLSTYTIKEGTKYIGHSAFSGCSNLTSINIPNSVTTIETYAFPSCPALTSVTIPNSVTSIGEQVFYNCTSLTSVRVEWTNDIVIPGENSFYNVDVSKITLYVPAKTETLYRGTTVWQDFGTIMYDDHTPVINFADNNVKALCIANWDLNDDNELSEYEASVVTNLGFIFNNNTEITSFDELSYFTGLTGICGSAFMNCTSLSSIDLSACTSIGGAAFHGCTALASVDLPACTSIGSGAFEYCSSLAGVGDLSACTSIGIQAFCQCTSLASVGDLSACTSIGDCAFYNCSSLASVGDLSACTSIGSSAFYQCSSLASVGDLSACTSIGDCAFYNCFSLASVGDLSACTSIGGSAFQSCSTLASVGDLSACTSIGDYAFQSCTALVCVDLSACTSIGYQAFSNCTSLASVGDLSACTSIGSSAFYACYALTSVDLSACTSIGNEAFRFCRLIPKLTFGTTIPPAIGDEVFGACPATLLVPAEAVAAYKAAENWSEYATRIISKDATTIWNVNVTVQEPGSGIETAIGTDNLNNVISLKVTGDINAYDIFTLRNNMPNLHSLDLTDANIVATASGYKYYGDYTTIKDTLNDYSFYQQSKLLDIKLPNTLKRIGNNAFDVSGISTITFNEELLSIGFCAFRNCKSLKNVSLPNSLVTIEGSAFEYDGYIKSIAIPSVESIGSNAFYNCCKIKTLDLPSNLKTIGGGAFYCCTGLTEVTLPVALTSIGNQAFDGTDALRNVYTKAIDPYNISIEDGTFSASTYANATLYIPWDEESGWESTYDAYRWHTQWGQFTNKAKWEPTYDYIQIGGDYDQDKGTIPGTDIDADLGDEAGYQVGDKGKQDFDDVHVKNDGEGSGASIIVDDKGELTVKTLFSDITVNANRWYFFCFPFDVKLADIVVPTGSSYVFRTYDGAKRAENGSGGWVNLDNEVTTLTAGKGYIFQCNIAGTLSIPVDNPDFTADDKSPELTEHSASNKQDANWNFVGNPYLSYYELEDLGHDAPVTYWNGSGYTAVRPGDDDYAIQPYQAFFVQKTDTKSEVTFDKDKRETYKQSQSKAGEAKARRAKAMVNKERMLVNVELSDGTNSDKTRVVFNDKQQMDYETECDASKFMSTEAVPQLYSIYNKVNYAINERPNGNGEVQLGFKVPADGSYTISVARMDTPMLLRDTETGTVFDFKDGSYTFDAQAGTNTTRFVLVKKDNVTAISPVVGTEGESASYYDINGQKTTSAAPGIKIVKENGSVKKMLVK